MCWAKLRKRGRWFGPWLRWKSNLEKELAASKFDQGGVITYNLSRVKRSSRCNSNRNCQPVPVRKRDILILICNSAAQAGEPGIAAAQIADAIIETAGPEDRISLWTYSTPDQTKPLVQRLPLCQGRSQKAQQGHRGFEIQRLARRRFRSQNRTHKAVRSFEGSDTRQRILLYLGDGQSMHNPIEPADRRALIQEMVKKRIAFFPVPLGLAFNPEVLHGFATGTGGVVLRTQINQEKLPEALKRYQQAFAGSILYDAQLKMPAGVIQVLPKNLPPVRADVPTLVVGRLQNTKSLTFTVTGTVAGRPGTVKAEATEKVPEAELDNYFLVSIIRQWDKAQTQAAMLRADRALALAFENTRQVHDELLLDAQVALERNEIVAALRLFEDARASGPA